MKKVMWSILILIVVAMASFLIVTQYSWVFRKSVTGEILEVERVTTSTAVVGATIPTQSFSFAIAIRQADGEIVTSSAEDRQWAVAKKGMCVEATVDPYAPWNFDKSGTYFNARLLKLKECAPGTAISVQPTATPEATPGN